MVVVGLVVVVAGVALAVIVLAAGVVAAAIKALLILRRVVPGVIGFLCTIEGNEFHHRVVAKPACLNEVAVQLGRGTVQIAFRAMFDRRP